MQPVHSCAAVIPCHNEAAAIAMVVTGALRHVAQVIVVDDGSADGTAKLAEQAGARVLRLERHSGKGAALAGGLQLALECGFAHAFTLDGDGQHAPDDMPRFVERAWETGATVVVGNRMGQAGRMPWLRRWVNWAMSLILSRMAGQVWPDSQCGFRLLHLETWAALKTSARHFEYESEQLLACARAGIKVQFVPVAVIYRTERSKISPLRDTVRWLRWLRHARSHV